MKNKSRLTAVTIGDKEYTCIIPQSSKEGLLNYNKGELGEYGMLFSFPSRDVTITSHGMKFPINIVIIQDYKIKDIIYLTPNNILETEGQYAVEFDSIADISSIKKGDTAKILNSMGDTVKVRVRLPKHEAGGQPHYQDTFLLDEKGHVQMILHGKERIFSREHTNKIMNLVSKKPTIENLMKLGQLVANIVKIHSEQKQEYVEE